MARKIGIIGMGNVGAAVAHGAIAQGLADSYVFIDINDKKAEADAQDFKDAMANLPSYAKIVVNDYAALEDADVIIHRLVIFSCSIMLVKIVLLNFHLPEKQSIKFLKNSKSWILKVSLWLFQILLMPYQLFTKNSLVGQRNVLLEQERCLIRPV